MDNTDWGKGQEEIWEGLREVFYKVTVSMFILCVPLKKLCAIN